jgi:hypothetical protein
VIYPRIAKLWGTAPPRRRGRGENAEKRSRRHWELSRNLTKVSRHENTDIDRVVFNVTHARMSSALSGQKAARTVIW